jgi:hypothetical protein
MNRLQRRATKRSRRRPDDQLIIAPSKSILVQVVAALAAGDPTISGATIIMPDGEVSCIPADILRRGGKARSFLPAIAIG